MPDIEIIEAPKQLAIAAQLAGIASGFQQTGNLSVKIAFTNGSWLEGEKPGMHKSFWSPGARSWSWAFRPREVRRI